MSGIQASKTQAGTRKLGVPFRLDSPTSNSRWLPEYAWVIGCAVLLLAILALVATWIVQHDGYRMIAFVLFLAAFVIAAGFVVYGRKIDLQIRRDYEEMQRRYQDMFARAGVSIWQEDWSAVGDAILSLREQGVTDIVRWYRDRPDEARALHARIQVTDVNLHGCHLMRAKDPSLLIGSLSEVVPGSFASFQRWLGALCSGERVYVSENRVRRLDGEFFDCYVTAALPADIEGYRQIMVSMIEITEYKRDSIKLAEAKEELARAQRVIMAGTLAATIAHEINSPLAAVASNAAACLRWLDKDPPVLHEARDAAQAALSAIERTQAVVIHTKSYFTRAQDKHVATDLRALVSSTLVLIEHEALQNDVSVSLRLDNEVSLKCDPVQVQQALVNLCMNAIQAMCTSNRPRQLVVQVASEEQTVSITVSDTGPGIEKDLLQAIFEPFYSTKSDGMGMGLAISRSCVERHGGWIEVKSELDQGTQFKLVLPIKLA
jgi:signal transduction histidine kinase